VVQRVEGLEAEFRRHSFLQPDLFERGEIRVIDPIAAHAIEPRKKGSDVIDELLLVVAVEARIHIEPTEVGALVIGKFDIGEIAVKIALPKPSGAPVWPSYQACNCHPPKT
jgi:hypothetical protein